MGLPGSLGRGGGFPPPVDLVSELQVLLPGPVFLVVSAFGGLLGLPVSLPGLLMVGGLGYCGDARQFGVELPVEHELVGGLACDDVRGASVRRHVLVDFLLQILAAGVCGVDDQF